jgi:hypothetical protein
MTMHQQQQQQQQYHRVPSTTSNSEWPFSVDATMIVVFVVDTSVSMNQQTAAGNMSVLDCAKALIEHFLKVRGRTQPLLMRQDRYFRKWAIFLCFFFVFCFFFCRLNLILLQ